MVREEPEDHEEITDVNPKRVFISRSLKISSQSNLFVHFN